MPIHFSLLVLDEIDQLDSHGQQVLYKLFEWPSLPDSHVILIGKDYFSHYNHSFTLFRNCKLFGFN